MERVDAGAMKERVKEAVSGEYNGRGVQMDKEGREGELRRVLLGTRRELLPSSANPSHATLPCPGGAQVWGVPGQHRLAENEPHMTQGRSEY